MDEGTLRSVLDLNLSYIRDLLKEDPALSTPSNLLDYGRLLGTCEIVLQLLGLSLPSGDGKSAVEYSIAVLNVAGTALGHPKLDCSIWFSDRPPAPPRAPRTH